MQYIFLLKLSTADLSDDEGLQNIHLKDKVLYGISEDCWESRFKQSQDNISLVWSSYVEPSF